MPEKRSAKPRWSVLRLVWLLFTIVGVAWSIHATKQVSELQRIHQDLQARAGLLEVKDPTKVYLTRIAQPVVPLAMKATVEEVWQFQVYLPPNYGVSHYLYTRLISEDGVISDGGWSGSRNSSRPEPIESILTLSLSRDGEDWRLSHSFSGGSGSSRIQDVDVDLFSDWIVTAMDNEPGESIELSPDQFFCPLFVRKPNPQHNKSIDGRKVPMYKGFALWVGPKSARSNREAAQRGKPITEQPVTQ